MLSLMLALGGCGSDQEFIEKRVEAIAVMTGDFDSVEDVLDATLVPFQLYEGYISGSAYEEVDVDSILLKAETLMTYVSESGVEELEMYDAVFINSGARGFGSEIYNALGPDDQFLTDSAALESVRAFVEDRGGILVVSDWSYDLIAAIWPSAMGFHGEEGSFDAAQVGEQGSFIARVQGQELKETLGEEISLQFPFSYWALIESVGADTEVLLEGSVGYHISGEEGYGTLDNVPLMTRFSAGRGKVVFTSFPWTSQNQEISGALLRYAASELPFGVGPAEEESEESSDEEVSP